MGVARKSFLMFLRHCCEWVTAGLVRRLLLFSVVKILTLADRALMKTCKLRLLQHWNQWSFSLLPSEAMCRVRCAAGPKPVVPLVPKCELPCGVCLSSHEGVC
jgi:hypothetical protein